MSSFFVPYDRNCHPEKNEWDGYKLILPCISVGNVPQLSIDLLINRFLTDSGNDLELIGYLQSKYVRPFAGPDPFRLEGNLLSTSMQVFVSKRKKLVLIQQRSPIYKEYRDDFYREMFAWLSRHRFALVIVLSSTFDQFLAPEYVVDQRGIPIMYLSNEHLKDVTKCFLSEKLAIKPVMKMDPDSMRPSENGKIHLPGSGSARSFLRHSMQQPMLCLVMYCSEGDNRHHSFYFADRIADILNSDNDCIVEKSDEELAGLYRNPYRWIEPFSWRMMFGDEPPPEMY
ncbi:Proteasome assembly chaperone 2 [Dermatophagoides farinae]|uniref:Proteasome assembly chaperone 2 n=1 Tax=Dermatophagoides farinae TaxID=6954 RepID=A0A922I637_DERFA|nr:proteasome assembly chaperone 2-like [Dermatophagoides farinae]KAH7637462.1 proteasome assembly chaperone 2-like protein [Dermatophagoides farinae]KAH9521415.1 Proteasome assembly chaperone 2 [Dermatophagoides farinae]